MMVAIIGGLVFILAGQQPIGKGLVLGSIFSVINFVLMAETLPMRLGKSKGKTFSVALGSIFVRYAILAIPMVVAIKFEQFNIFATILGIFMIQLMILSDHLIAGIISQSSRRQKIR